jgi:hypothetical protein
MKYIGALTGLAAKVLAKHLDDIGLVVHDHDADGVRKLHWYAHTHDAASPMVAP